MNFRRLSLLLLTVVFTVSFNNRVFAENKEKPNVIVILADDMGFADGGFQRVHADDICTPNLDQIAKEGVVFHNAYAASPVCSNSRLGLFTGRYQQRWGAYYYGQGGMPSNEYSIAEMMLQAGYRTMKVGKTHLNNGPKSDPMKHGFEQYLGFEHHSWDFHLISQKDVDAYEKKSPGSIAMAKMAPIGPLTRNNGEKASFENTTTTEVFTKESIRFIKEKDERPFYLQLEFNSVHTPLIRSPKELRKKYGIPDRPFKRNAKVWEYPLWDPVAQPNYMEWYNQACHLEVVDPYGRKIYLAHLEYMDRMIGKIVQTVKKRGEWDNTILFFSSDNGGSDQSYANNGDINAYKYCLMDGGIKVPMIMSWPNKFGGDKDVEAVVTHRDLFPSLSEVTGVAPKKKLDGVSILPLIDVDKNEIHADEPLFWDCGMKNVNWVARDGDWKLVYAEKEHDYKPYKKGDDGLVSGFSKFEYKLGMQLFNMADDPGETKDLSDKYPNKVKELTNKYKEWRGKMGEPISGKKAK